MDEIIEEINKGNYALTNFDFLLNREVFETKKKRIFLIDMRNVKNKEENKRDKKNTKNNKKRNKKNKKK